jgi:hypothetical protein
MNAVISEPFYLGWAVALFSSLAALLKWRYRREYAARRVSKGLRAYTGGPQAIS